MARTAGDIFASTIAAARKRKVVALASWSLAATTGVATAIDTDDPGITLSRTGAGTYALTFPATPGRLSIDAEVLNTGASAAGMVTGARLSAKSPSAGTATVQIVGGNSGVAIDPLAADVVTLTLTLTLDTTDK